jgi:hypothetical protein
MRRGHEEPHRINSIGWRRAALLGANDGINSTATLITGVASAPAEQDHLRLDGSRDQGDVNGDRGASVSFVTRGYGASSVCRRAGGARC